MNPETPTTFDMIDPANYLEISAHSGALSIGPKCDARADHALRINDVEGFLDWIKETRFGQIIDQRMHALQINAADNRVVLAAELEMSEFIELVKAASGTPFGDFLQMSLVAWERGGTQKVLIEAYEVMSKSRGHLAIDRSRQPVANLCTAGERFQLLRNGDESHGPLLLVGRCRRCGKASEQFKAPFACPSCGSTDIYCDHPGRTTDLKAESSQSICDWCGDAETLPAEAL